MASISKQVYLLVRSKIRASEILVSRLNKLPNIKVMLGYSPVKIIGEDKVVGIDIRNNLTEEESSISLDGIFIEAGGIPNNGYLPESVTTNKSGEIISDKYGVTNISGLFAAGDVTDRKDKQVVIAAGEGAAAALAAHDYLLRH